MPIQPFLDRISKYVNLSRVEAVFDVGAGYGEDTVEFAKRFPAAGVFAIECNPACLVKCLDNLEPYLNTHMICAAAWHQHAVWHRFRPIDPERTQTTHKDGNPRASSLFVANQEYPHEKYAQYSGLWMACIRLEELADRVKQRPDIIWMDVQGAEYNALMGAGEILGTVRAVHVEVQIKPAFGVSTDAEVKRLLGSYGLEEIHREPWSEYFQDVDYVRTDHATS